MMKNCLALIVALITLMTLSSCEKDFIIEEQQTEKKMVVNCLFDNISPFKVYLSSSFPLAGSASLSPLPDATVLLYEDGALRETLTYVPSDSVGTFGRYESATPPLPGRHYKLVIHHPVYGEVTAEDSLPAVPVVASHAFEPNASDSTAIFRFRLNDVGGVKNYYRANFYEWNYWWETTSGDSVRRDYFTGYRPEPLTALADTARENYWFLLFSDKNFDGLQKEISLDFGKWFLRPWIAEDHVALELSSVSFAHYEYYRTLEIFNRYSSGSEPVHVYDNITNGYGIFAGHSALQLVVRVK